MKRIVCIGNKFVQGDDFGSRVYMRLLERTLPDDVQVVDGGVTGLNLLRFFDGCERLVFVDSIGNAISPDEVLVLEDDELITNEVTYSHASGLGYVLQANRAIRNDSLPRIFLVGADVQATEQVVAAAVERCVQLIWDRLLEQ